MNRITSNFSLFLLLVSSLILSCSRNNENDKIHTPDSTYINKMKAEILSGTDTISGKRVYESSCLVCHQPNGVGIPGIYPPLAKSDYLIADKRRALTNIIHGFKDSIKVNGKTYKGNIMPYIELSDKELRDVMNYILLSWDNKGGIITLDDVKASQKQQSKK